MKANRNSLLALLMAASLASPLARAEEPAALTNLGFLNGMALACKQPALVARLRDAVVAVVPKTREAGETFEQATNMAFLGYSDNAVCPDGKTLAERVDIGIAELKAAYGAAK